MKKQLSRRHFVKGAAITSAAVITAGQKLYAMAPVSSYDVLLFPL